MKKYIIIFPILKKIVPISLITVLMVCTSFSMAQNDHFIYMDNGKFYEGCEEFYPVVMNYTITPYRDAQGDYHIMPHKSWCENIGDCYSCGTTPSEFRSRIVNHLQMIVSKGFNTIRLVGLSVSLKQNMIDGQNQFLKNFYYWEYDPDNPDCPKVKNPGFHIENSNDFHKIGDLIEDFINIIKEENLDLKVIVLTGHHGVEVVSSLYTGYLSYLSDKFKDEPIIFAYDLYNEPYYENKMNEVSYDKYDVANWFSQWYGAIKENAPSHLVTFGPKQQGVINWDAEILSVDFLSYHIYPIWIENNNWNYDLAFSYYNCLLYWFSDVYSKPWIIGETGYSGVPDGMNQQYPHIGTYTQQETFAGNTLNYNKWYGSEGYSWWIFKDNEWVTSSPGNYMGLSWKGEDDDWKPAADKFVGYIPNEECPSCTLPTQNEMMNPLAYDYLLMEDIVYDEFDNPLQNAIVLANIIKENPINNEDKHHTSLSFTNEDGMFKIYFSTDEAFVACVKIGYPEMETIKQENWEIGFTTLNEGNDTFNPLDLEQIPEIPNYDNWVIDEGEEVLWDSPKVVKSGNVEIKDGAILTVKTNVFFNSNSKLIVERGGTLVIDENGVLTSNCNNALWKGVELWGNASLSQGSDEQGRVYLFNGAAIENAIYGIRACKVETDETKGTWLNYNYTGGIVQAGNAVFKNNFIAADLPEYPKSGYNYESSSLFTSCEFITDDDYMGENKPDYFVKMKGINSVDFTNCLFENESSTNFYGNGIRTANARSLIKADFVNLYYGIYATSTSPSKFIEVSNTDFINTYRGVYISGMTNAVVESNNFSINSPFSQNDGGYGLYLDHSTAYKVEENNFYHEGQNTVGVGLVVNQSGGEPNMIYRNWFTNLDCGMDIQGENRAKDGTGLELRCNQYEDTKMDKIITWESPFVMPFSGIASSQGSSGSNPEDMAGNLFQIDNENPNGDFDDILNEANHITYYYPLNYGFGFDNVKPVDYTHNTITLEPIIVDPEWTNENGCPPSGGGGGIGDTKGKMAETGQKVDSTENLLSLLIDGGNTEEVQTDVDNSIPPETMQVYNDLISKSPYLSDTVISTAIEKEDVLPGAMIRDIMVANPKAAKSEKLMQKLDERWNPLPEYMKAQILQGRSIVSIREETDSRLAAFKLEKAKHFNALVRYYLTDTVNPQASIDSLSVLLQTESSLNAKYKLAMMKVEYGAWGEGLIVLNNIPSQFELTPAEAEAHLQITAYYSLLSDMAQQGKTVFEADTTQITTLFDIEGSQSGMASVFARNILLALNEMEYDEPVILPDLLKSAAAMDEYNELLSKTAEAPRFIKVQPNPAKDYIIVEYEFEQETNATIEINDISGNLKYANHIQGKRNQFTIDTRRWKAGIYIATLKINGRLIESAKFTIID